MSKDKQAAVWKVGDPVESARFRGVGAILEGPNRKGEWLIGIGALSIWLPESMMSPSTGAAAKEPKAKPSRNRADRTGSGVTQRLDLHGHTVNAALERLERELDRALLGQITRLEIIHGLGTGTLKDAIHRYLGSSPHVRAFKLDAFNPGVTWAFLEG